MHKLTGAKSLRSSPKDTADKSFELFEGAGELMEKLEELYYLSDDGGLTSTENKSQKNDKKKASEQATARLIEKAEEDEE